MDDWCARAACAGAPTDVFFKPELPAKHLAQALRSGRRSPEALARRDLYVEARSYCVRCPVVADCLAAAIDEQGHDPYGFRAGLTAYERLLLVRSDPSLAAGGRVERRAVLRSLLPSGRPALPTDSQGRRVCEVCGQRFERRSTPGRYPLRHPECVEASTGRRAEAG